MIIDFGKVTVRFCLIALMGTCLCPLSPAQAGSSEGLASGSSETAPNLPRVYQQWLDEDVRWIITPEERADFLRLATNEERTLFVEQFWLRRDPTPNTAENEYKEEHYRRIAYANLHFAWQAIPGWNTDRGRIYIQYGPPDRIKADLDGNGNSGTSTLLWHYDSMSGHEENLDMIFIDACHCGDYHLKTKN